MTSVTINKLDGGYTLSWYWDQAHNQPTPPGYRNEKVFLSLEDALGYARKLLKDKEEK